MDADAGAPAKAAAAAGHDDQEKGHKKASPSELTAAQKRAASIKALKQSKVAVSAPTAVDGLTHEAQRLQAQALEIQAATHEELAARHLQVQAYAQGSTLS